MTPAERNRELASRVVLHKLASPHLDELARWKPPNPTTRRVRPELDGQLDLLDDEVEP